MKILVDENGLIKTVSRNEINLENCIIVEDNEDLIINPSKYLYVNGNLILRPYVSIITDKIDTNNNGIPDSNTNHNLTITFYNSDGSINNNINGVYKIKFILNPNSYIENDVIITNGVGNFMINKHINGIFLVTIDYKEGYVNNLLIEFI